MDEHNHLTVRRYNLLGMDYINYLESWNLNQQLHDTDFDRNDYHSVIAYHIVYHMMMVVSSSKAIKLFHDRQCKQLEPLHCMVDGEVFVFRSKNLNIQKCYSNRLGRQKCSYSFNLLLPWPSRFKVFVNQRNLNRIVTFNLTKMVTICCIIWQ